MEFLFPVITRTWFTDTDLTTVTPVLQLLSVSLLPTISFVAPPAPDQNGNLGNDGRRGVMSGRRAAANLPAKNAFELNGEVITEGIRIARVVQTLDIDSGHHGTGGTYIDVNGVQYKYGIDPNDLTLVTPSGMRSSFPLVDGATSASAPFYDNSTTSALQPGRNPGDPPFRNLRAVDSPGLIIGDILFGESVTSIDALFSFKVYVVAEYDDKSIYTIAAYDWRANFYATTRVAGRGVTVIQADSMVTGDSGPRRSHLDPDITTGKTVSEAVSVI